MGRSRLPAALRAQSGPKSRTARSTGPRAPKAGSELEAILLNRLERAGLPAPALQYRIIPGRQFRWDMAWSEIDGRPVRVCIEVQGGVWSGGSHVRGSGVQRDCLKASMAAALGWRCLPVTREMIESGQAVELIAQALEVEGTDYVE